MDARFPGYEGYQCFDYSIFLGSNPDCPDRYPSRFNEMIESRRIIYAIIFPRFNSACYFSRYSCSSFPITE